MTIKTIANGSDLAHAQIALIEFGWFHFAVVDKNRCAWLLCEHEDGEMYATCGSEDGWLHALRVVLLHGPLTVLQDLSPKPFGRPAAQLGDSPWPPPPHDHTAMGCATTDHPCPDMSCPHCPCTYTTECCHCDGTRTPLEDS